MASYTFILTGSFFIKVTNQNRREDCLAARKILKRLGRLRKVNDVEVLVVHEVDQHLESESEDNLSVYNFLKAFYEEARSYAETEFDATTRLAKDKIKERDYILIVNGSNAYDEAFSEIEKQKIKVASEINTLKFIADELHLKH